MISLLTVFRRKIQEIDGFKNLPIKIDGFGRTQRTHTNGAPDTIAKIQSKNLQLQN